ncbi:ATP--guanido phosphotransferase [Capsulimonas corticalis]|uniref:ATP--guanido phosphotransferase n=1 Tax=Capsulimonas corticalis TaxID=2219043 RepID=UPI000FFACB2C|nr:ATP--guanido phosphotransferase [Capsulimonas corticalis]
MEKRSEASGASLPIWTSEAGWAADVVLSTRARLARNLGGYPFPGKADAGTLSRVGQAVIAANNRRTKGEIALRVVEIDRLNAVQRAALIDRHLISVQHATAGPSRWALVDDKHTTSVMVNEEDHLRIQAILPGLQLSGAWRIADELDDRLAEDLEYARHNCYGFLTSSLANCGTGLRLSVMAHLPGLTLARKLDDALSAARTLGVTVRGSYGEDVAMAGDVYQLSNAVSLGMTERQILARLSAVTTFIVADEQAARELLWRNERSMIISKVTEALAKLGEASRLSATDAMSILSMLRLGDELGMETGGSRAAFRELLVSMRIGTEFVSGINAQNTFYEENRRPALIRNVIRAQRRAAR